MLMFWPLVVDIFLLLSDINLIFFLDIHIMLIRCAATIFSGIQQRKPTRPAYQPKIFENG